MNKKDGYTLIELLIVISLIVVVMVSTVIAFSSTVKNTEKNSFENMEKDILTAAEIYFTTDEGLNRIVYSGEQIKVYISDLQASGLISDEIIDYKTNDIFNDKSYVTVKLEDGEIKYELFKK